MKRTPLKPRTKPLPRATKALVRHALLKNRKPIRAKGKSRFPHRRNKAYCDAIRSFPCLLTGLYDLETGAPHKCEGPVEVAHVKSRGAGGSDERGCIALCHAAHASQHQMGIKSFERRWFTTDGVLQNYAETVYPRQVARRVALGWDA